MVMCFLSVKQNSLTGLKIFPLQQSSLMFIIFLPEMARQAPLIDHHEPEENHLGGM